MIHFNASAEGASGVVTYDEIRAAIETVRANTVPPVNDSFWCYVNPLNPAYKYLKFKRYLRKSQRTTMRRLRFEANRRKR